MIAGPALKDLLVESGLCSNEDSSCHRAVVSGGGNMSITPRSILAWSIEHDVSQVRRSSSEEL
jgi:hypothetical protein